MDELAKKLEEDLQEEAVPLGEDPKEEEDEEELEQAEARVVRGDELGSVEQRGQ